VAWGQGTAIWWARGDYAKQARADSWRKPSTSRLRVSGLRPRDDLIKQTIFVVDYRPELVPLILGAACTAGTAKGRGECARRRPGPFFAPGYLIEIEGHSPYPPRR